MIFGFGQLAKGPDLSHPVRTDDSKRQIKVANFSPFDFTLFDFAPKKMFCRAEIHFLRRIEFRKRIGQITGLVAL
jgi:hypothetical protein